MTPEEAAQPVTRGDAERITNALNRLTSKYRWTLGLSIVVAIAVALAGIAIVLGATALVQLKHESQCVATLAAASADRTGVLAPLSTARSNAADDRQDAESALILTLIPNSATETKAQRTARFEQALETFHTAAENYAQANRAYEQAYSQNPPPKAPSFHC